MKIISLDKHKVWSNVISLMEKSTDYELYDLFFWTKKKNQVLYFTLISIPILVLYLTSFIMVSLCVMKYWLHVPESIPGSSSEYFLCPLKTGALWLKNGAATLIPLPIDDACPRLTTAFWETHSFWWIKQISQTPLERLMRCQLFLIQLMLMSQ